MKLARTLMIQGTASTVGKSTLVTGLCRLFAQEGWRVAPFKAQNMSLNAAVTPDGREISRAQAVQAEAAGIEPTVEMNPILLKPEGNARSQVIVMGRPLAAMEAREYYRHRTGFLAIVQQSLATLRKAYELVIIEGAGSPVELNLAHYDLVNMRVAQIADAPVLLVGDIDRGGIFAAILGTLMLLQPEERERVKGLIVNRFRGDLSLWKDGEQLLAARSGIPVLGTIPFLPDLRLAEEDAVALNEGTAALVRNRQEPMRGAVDVVLVRLPYLSNYDEFDSLAADSRVRLHVVAQPDEFPAQPDLIILPGTKNTLADLAWLWRRGLAQHIRSLVKQGSAVLGICGGYQMLGERVYDPEGAEAQAGTVEPGLGLLSVETIFRPTSDKLTRRSLVRIDPTARRGLFAYLPETTPFQVYQIRVGHTRSNAESEHEGSRVFLIAEEDVADGAGWMSEDGWRVGCPLHGLFEHDAFRHGIVEALLRRRSTDPLVLPQPAFHRQHEYDRLAETLRQHLNLQQLKFQFQMD